MIIALRETGRVDESGGNFPFRVGTKLSIYCLNLISLLILDIF